MLNDTDGSGRVPSGASLPVYEHFTWVKAVASGGTVIWTLNLPSLGLTSPQTIGQGSNTGLFWNDKYNNYNAVNFGTNP